MSLSPLENWYSRQCNGDWEHGFGVDISTIAIRVVSGHWLDEHRNRKLNLTRQDRLHARGLDSLLGGEAETSTSCGPRLIRGNSKIRRVGSIPPQPRTDAGVYQERLILRQLSRQNEASWGGLANLSSYSEGIDNDGSLLIAANHMITRSSEQDDGG